MDLPTSPTTPLGPMTRARAKAIEDKVNSLLFELPLSMHETWLLPQVETLCVIRYMEESHGAATSIGQDNEDTKRQTQGNLAEEDYSGRTFDQDQTSDDSRATDDRPSPDIRRYCNRAEIAEVQGRLTTGPLPTSDARATERNLRKSEDLRTSGPSEPLDVRRPPDVRSLAMSSSG